MNQVVRKIMYRRKNQDWRQFEQLVARIEKQLAPKGAVVLSPDRIRDKVTGRPREVDGSIRYQVGSVPLLITIECRKRGRRQDDTWIEQLVSKREKLGAHQTVVVSSTGFTESAIATAKRYGLELRRIDDITNEMIADWVNKVIIQRLTVHDTIIRWSFEVDAAIEEVKFDWEIENAVRENANGSPVLFRQEDNAGISINGLLENFYRWQEESRLGQDSYVGLKGEHSEVVRRITMNLAANKFYTLTNVGRVMVKQVTIDLQTHINRESVQLPRVYQYSNLQGGITQIAVGSFSSGQKPEERFTVFVQPMQDQDT